MSKNQILIFLLVLACTFSSCEKDDLCIPEELDIPRLVIVFVDDRNQLLRKPVANLQVLETEGNTPIALDNTGSTTLTQVDSIAIPLRIDASLSEFAFLRTLDGSENSDPINFEYVQDEEYLNRACGFKSIYTDLIADRLAETPDNPWITNVIIRNPDVTSNQDIHVEIRH